MLTSLILGFLIATVYGQYLSTIPITVPLIHKSPDINSWAWPRGTIPGEWPRSVTGDRKLRWLIAVRVDGTGYVLQGTDANYTAPERNATFITSTRTIFMMDAGPVRLNLTYLTPIELNDWTRHSLPFGYLSIDLWSTDGRNHSVQLYSDIPPDFGSSDGGILQWGTIVTSTLIYHQALEYSQGSRGNAAPTLQKTQFLTFRTTPRVALTWQSCLSTAACRNNFTEVGRLGNTSVERNTTSSNDPVMALALDMGNVTQSDNPLVFALGSFKQTDIMYSLNRSQSGSWMKQNPLWQRRWSNIWEVIDSSLLDFPQTHSRAAALDTKIVSDTFALASNLGLPISVTTSLTNIVIMSVRQTIGSLEITTNLTGQGSLKIDDSRVFLKDFGLSERVNPVEVIYASFPAFLYLNSSLAGKLLEPLFEAGGPGSYNSEYAMFDLDSNWPFASTRPNPSSDFPISIESSSSMLILALAYTQKSGDRSLVSRYYTLLLKWADFLVNRPLDGLDLKAFTTEDGNHSAMSNLALKGITGIYAMGKISQLLEGYGYSADTNRTSLYYLEKAQNYAQRWQNITLSSTHDHIVSVFGDDKTWGLLYNLYAVRLIGADFIPDKVYKLQASWYNNLTARIRVDSNCGVIQYENMDLNVVSKTHWALLAAGSISQDMTGTRDAIINNVHSFTFGRFDQANPSTCSRDDNRSDSTRVLGAASPANGAAFVLHALSLPNLITNQPGQPNTSATVPQPGLPSSRFSYKLGIVLAVLATLTLVGIFFYWRRLHRQRRMNSNSLPAVETDIAPYVGQHPTTSRHPHKHRAFEPVAQQSPDHEANSNNNPETRINHIQEENLRIQVERLMVENEVLRERAIPPPPYTGSISS